MTPISRSGIVVSCLLSVCLVGFGPRRPAKPAESAGFRKPTAGMVREWSEDGNCAEKNAAGEFHRWVHRDLCRKEVGHTWGWAADGHSCGEYTPAGALIDYAPRSCCEVLFSCS
jgi:hypothetical protein